MSLKITHLNGKDAGKYYEFDRDRTLVMLGRDQDVNDVVFSEEWPMVGRQHLGLQLVLGRYRLVVNPQNAVLLDGKRAKEGAVLGDQATLQLGADGPLIEIATVHESRANPTMISRRAPSETLPQQRSHSRWTQVRQSIRTNRALTALTLLLLIGVVGSVLWALRRQNEDRDRGREELWAFREELRKDHEATRAKEKEELQRELAKVLKETDLSARFQETLAEYQGSVALLETTVSVNIDPPQGKPFTMKSEGTGFLVGDGRYMVTNHHVVNMLHYVGAGEDDATMRRFCSVLDQRFGEDKWSSEVSEILVWFPGQLHDEDAARSLTKGDVKLVGYATMDEGYRPKWQAGFSPQTTDLALLEFTKPLGKPLKLAQVATELKPFEQVVLLGYPLGFHKFLLAENKVALNPFVGTVRRVAEFVQTTVPTYPGNSGGPLLDRDGRVVGVMTSRIGENLSRCVRVEAVHILLKEFKVQ